MSGASARLSRISAQHSAPADQVEALVDSADGDGAARGSKKVRASRTSRTSRTSKVKARASRATANSAPGSTRTGGGGAIDDDDDDDDDGVYSGRIEGGVGRAALPARTKALKRRTGRFSDVVRRSSTTSTARLSSSRLSRRSVRAEKRFTDLIVPSRTKQHGAPLNDAALQLNVIDNFCTYLERYALGIEHIFEHEIDAALARKIATTMNQPDDEIDFADVDYAPDMVAAALRAYLEAHKRAVLPAGNYQAFVDANAEEDDDARKSSLCAAVAALDDEHRAMLLRIVRLCYSIAESAADADSDRLATALGDVVLHNEQARGGEKASGADMLLFMIENYYPVVFMGDYAAERKKGGAAKKYNTQRLLTSDDWRLLLVNAKLFKYKKDQMVVKEGEPSTLLYRVRKGDFHVYKNEAPTADAARSSSSKKAKKAKKADDAVPRKHVGTLQEYAVFGEIAFLGSYVSDVTVVAANDDAELWILDMNFIRQIFAFEPELSLKFHHFIGNYIANRLQFFVADDDDDDDDDDDGDGGGGAANTSAKVYVSRGDSGVAVPAKQSSGGATGPLAQELVVRDYQCEFDGKPGTLYVMQHYITHFAPAFGREKKKYVALACVKSLSMSDTMKELVVERSASNVPPSTATATSASGGDDDGPTVIVTLAFSNAQDCDEAFALLETMLMGRGTPGAYPAVQHTGRAVALYDFDGDQEHDLKFKAGDVITVLQKRADGWWLGRSGDKTGYYPSNFCRDDDGLPTVADWQIVYLGAKTKSYKKGDIIFEEDSLPRGLFQLLEGTCETVRNGKVLGVLRKDDTFGDVAFLSRKPAPNGVRAASKCTVREIPAKYLDKLFENAPGLAARVYKFISIISEMKLRRVLDPPPPPVDRNAAPPAAATTTTTTTTATDGDDGGGAAARRSKVKSGDAKRAKSPKGAKA